LKIDIVWLGKGTAGKRDVQKHEKYMELEDVCWERASHSAVEGKM
jgi:hypothetical protein